MSSEVYKRAPTYQEACRYSNGNRGREIEHVARNGLTRFMAVLAIFGMSFVLIHAELLPQTVDRATGGEAWS